MTEATPSTVPESTKERPIILQWAERILAGDPKGTYAEYEFAAQLVILIPKVEALERRDHHFTPLMEALGKIAREPVSHKTPHALCFEYRDIAQAALKAAEEATS